MSNETVFLYSLLKYGRLSNAGESSLKKDHWEIYNGEQKELNFVLYNTHHLAVVYDNIVQETYFLLNCQTWMRGTCKDDSMLFIIKIQNQCRQFRIKFAPDGTRTGQNNCSDCTAILAQYFPIKIVARNPESGQEQLEEPKRATNPVLQGNIPISQIAQVTSGQLKASMPLAYQRSHMSNDEVASFLRRCLMDSSFSSFVGQVEKELQTMELEMAKD